VSAEHALLIVGGGPAGLATAIAARLAGLDVAVVDRAAPPLDKACGEGLMPDALACLRGLGVALASSRLAPFHGIRYLDGDLVAEGRFPGVSGAGVRRLHLHEAMCRRAREVGVTLLWRRRVRGLVDAGGVLGVETDAGALTARWLVGADGLRSRVRRWSGLDGRPSLPRRFGVRRHFAVAPWTDLVEVWWADGCEAYVTPVGAEEVGVALLWSDRKAGFDELMSAFPALAERLRGASVTSRDRGAGPLRQRARAVARGRLALVGDASGYVDAITGEGLALAFRQAGALVASLERGDLGLYERRHREIGRWADGLTRLLLRVEARPWLRRRVIRALARDPALFSRVLAVHSGAWPLRGLGLASAPRLLWGLVRS
jgi:flavin-dependent dehydrogenase